MFFFSSTLCMGRFLFFVTGFIFLSLVSGSSFSEFIYPNFTASHIQFIDHSGAFLSSRNGTFKAAIFNPGAQQTKFYLCVIHVVSNNIIWSANRDTPISSSGKMNLTPEGIIISDQNGSLRWSTSTLKSSVNALLLTEMGNLVLLDQFNGSLWESFHYPTDTIAIGQHLLAGVSLSSALSDYDLSTGNYSLTVGASDAVLQWQGQTYWKLSMDTKAYVNSNYMVEYMSINRTGLYLFGKNGSAVVMQVTLSPSNFRIAKLDASGQFTVISFSSKDSLLEFVGPNDGCRIPFICGKVGLCTDDTISGSPTCSCPSGFRVASQNASGCMPSDGSQSLPVACNSTKTVSQLSSSVFAYLRLDYGMDYFTTDFSDPIKYGVGLSVCQDFCSADCSCLGIFYRNSSGSCYVLENVLGSIISTETGDDDLLGYIKVVVGPKQTNLNPNNSLSYQGQKLPLSALVLLPFTGFVLLAALGFLWWRRSRVNKAIDWKSGHTNSLSSEDLDTFYIPGLPQSGSSGVHSSSSSSSGLVYFPLFALEMHEQGRYLELADPRLEGRVTSEEVEKLVRVALCCVHEEPVLRPNIVSVVGILEGGIPLGHPRVESLNFLRFYGRRFTEASMIEEDNEQTDFRPKIIGMAAHLKAKIVLRLKISKSLVCSPVKLDSIFLDLKLVKNTFLKNERTVSRKIVEMVLAIALERVMSKWEILSSYMSKIYWGHGIYGIESASAFYFRKHPSLLSLGESAMLAGIVPAPELRSPLRDCSRGKTFQARVLKRMVEVGFIDVETALLIVKESLHLHVVGLKNADRLLYLLSFSSEGIRGFNELNQAGTKSSMKDIWDWEQESKIREACEDMERWAINKVSKGSPSKISSLK
ncbi:hypothetical protein EZV62_022114 [Acer yangbiense]|uniref:Bulb-type lectin domain-containing protein n=1 Tax=Acer yangbiense TaxID=1000413 RepID=A0A5C7H8Z2_9ROSI|nr:hypothetical protein EZV62_022114 [Acer yangbiense]